MTVSRLVVMGLLAGGCFQHNERSACGPEALNQIITECHQRVVDECEDYDSCPTLKECDRMIDEWQLCK